MNLQIILTAALVVLTFMSPSAFSESKDRSAVKARLAPAAVKSSKANEQVSDETKNKISHEVEKYLGTDRYKALLSVKAEPSFFESGKSNAANRLALTGLPSKYHVVAKTKDNKVVALRVIETKGAVAVMPD